MTSDPNYGGQVLWEGRPKETRGSSLMQVASILAYAMGIVAIAFGVVRAQVFGDLAATPLLFSFWSVTVGALTQVIPVWWHGGSTYRVTGSHVVCQRGPFHRTIERREISFARIHWSPRLSGVGTLELVRAVPTGAMKRQLAVSLEGIMRPDGVWAIIRGAEAVAFSGKDNLPLSQRLDRGERILWSAKPFPGIRAYLPSGTNQWYLSTVALTLITLTAFTAVRSISILSRLSTAGIGAKSVPFWALSVGLVFAFLGILLVSSFIARSVFVDRARSLKNTRYLISNKRVLIQCGRNELHLDRRNIVDIIDTPAGVGKSNLFLVLDGPRARALAANGAFQDDTHSHAELMPVFECVQDGEGAKLALARRSPSVPPMPRAA